MTQFCKHAPVVWLSQKTGKPILKLTDEDYSEHNLSELIIEHDNSYNINIKVFNRLQHTITGRPGCTGLWAWRSTRRWKHSGDGVFKKNDRVYFK